MRGRVLALIIAASVLAWLAGTVAVVRAVLAFDRVDPALLGLFVACTAALIALLLWLYARAARGATAAAALLAKQPPDAGPPVPLDRVAPELRPLIAQVEALRRRFAGVLEAERRFAAAAAHELRTPLAAVRVQAQVAERARTPEDAREALSQLQVCVERASRTIDQLLTLAQLEAAQVHPTTVTTVDLASLAARVVQDMNPLLRARGIELTMNLQPVAVQGLEHGLAALLRNLLDNAARHTPPSSRVAVASGAAHDHAVIAVDDSGPGIPPEERDRVFERFYRLPANESDGAGVGLSIVQSVARAHGGRIELTDSDLGGLRAVLFLRQHQAGTPAADRAAPAADRVHVAAPNGAAER